ncbi:MAG: hypothetical protein KJT03_19425, partial [Verrucomicrobiae bacterium]|nr:hypothetical protein [Verrucomicrobiae bacterium]
MKYSRAARQTPFLVFFMVTTSLLSAQGDLRPLGVFDHHQDVGGPAIAGAASYDPALQTYRMSAAGANMWAEEDQFHFAWKKIQGDFILSCTV